ncbi:hypothetical protein JRO89_XS06G0266200 [Xanthoceras sorbifolium]|uniref:Glycosyl transferase 64 domain-containing protein n=1 Tax=Xanthoceras sorbifolium TaxID=99658 RepID=A0ABQ8HZH9_9ROSI|nr:hypothetical protein JRO89_XS06G0266200 [Xanthoceras sorbifolium]
MVMRGSLLNNHRRTVQRFRQVVGPLKIKLLLCFCIAFTAILILTRASFFIDSTHSLDPLSHSRFSISHYATCSGLHSIHIIWSEPDPPSDSLRKFLHHIVQKKSSRVELKFDINHEDSLNNRFKEIKDLNVDAVFSIDDDVIFPCTSVKFAFDVWQSAPDTMVGFVPRRVFLDQSVIAVLFSNSLRDINVMRKAVLSFLMSVLHIDVVTIGTIYEIGSTGISSLGGHSERRTQCINRFVAEFGRMPLVSTSVKAVDSRGVWFW